MRANLNNNSNKKKKYCYWAVGDGEYAILLKSLVKSARSIGVTEDFHVWSDRDIEGAISHRIDSCDIGKLNINSSFLYEFKFKYLKKMVQFEYDYYVYLDSDIYFTRKPDDPLVLLKGDPIHLFLETNLNTTPRHRCRSEWWGCPLPEIVRAMRECGVQNKNIYNLNGGFWIIDRRYVSEVLNLSYKFWQCLRDKGYPNIADEIPLSYAMHVLCRNPEDHLLSKHRDYFGNCDYVNFTIFKKILNRKTWITKCPFTGTRVLVNPAVVHCISLKDKLIENYLDFPQNIIYKIYKIKKFLKKTKN